jgi:hypothetical protein
MHLGTLGDSLSVPQIEDRTGSGPTDEMDGYNQK